MAYIDCDKCYHGRVCAHRHHYHDMIVECNHHIPTADVVEVKHGEWLPIVIQDNYLEPPYCDSCKCSVCEYEIDVSETVYNYCPNCGAKMDGERRDT